MDENILILYCNSYGNINNINDEYKFNKVNAMFSEIQNKLKSVNKKYSIIDINSLNFIKVQDLSRKSTNSKDDKEEEKRISLSNRNFTLSESDLNSCMKAIKESKILIFVFPIINGSCPSKLTMFIETCMTIENSFNNKQVYSNGPYKGKKACVIGFTDYSIEDYSYKGKFILSLDEIIEHFTHGVLALLGFSVIKNYFIYKNSHEFESFNYIVNKTNDVNITVGRVNSLKSNENDMTKLSYSEKTSLNKHIENIHSEEIIYN